MASSPELLSDAFIETTISGAEVPTETMVRPITRGEIPIFRAVASTTGHKLIRAPNKACYAQ